MTVAMALVENAHLSSRGQTNARAGVWGREMNCTATIRDPSTPKPELFRLHDEEPGGTRPDMMPSLSGPHEQVLRHTVDQIVVAVDFRCSCAADCGPAGGRALAPGHADSRARCLRSARDLVPIPLISLGSSGAAEGGTAGGSANSRVSRGGF